MELDHANGTTPGIIHPVPTEGLNEVLRVFSGAGGLFNGLSAIEPTDLFERRWTAQDIEKRACRIVYELISPHLSRWPSNSRDWINAIPGASIRTREISSAPLPRTDWAATARTYGWPPAQFVGRRVDRSANALLLTVAKWVITEAYRTSENAHINLENGNDHSFHRLHLAYRALLNDLFLRVDDVVPTHADLRAVRREGRPWTEVAIVGEQLLRLRNSVHELAQAILVPDLAPRLFHLGVLGTTLLAAKRAGCQVVSYSPIAAGSNRPTYVLMDVAGRTWHVWFEGASMWPYYGRIPFYKIMVSVLRGEVRPLSEDIVMYSSEARSALILECKYSTNRDYIGRHGSLQLIGYSAQVRHSLAETIVGRVVVPVSGVTSQSSTLTPVGDLGICSPDHLEEIVMQLLQFGDD